LLFNFLPVSVRQVYRPGP